MIDKQIIQIVDEAILFQASEEFQNMKRFLTPPPQMWKRVKIETHRRAGATTAALKLLEIYTSSLIVTPSYLMARRVQREAQKVLSLEYFNSTSLSQQIISESVLTETYFQNWPSYARHQLIILDPATLIETNRGRDNMDELRMRLYTRCDLLVELG